MALKKFVVIKTQFPAIHRYPEATGQTAYLRHSHRHVFYVVMKWEVQDNNREIEFLKKKTEANRFIFEELYDFNIGELSCEDLAELLAKKFEANFVSVFEDNENGAEYHADYTI